MSSHCNNNNSFYPYPMQKTSYYGCSQQQYNTASCPSTAPPYYPPYYPPPYYAYPTNPYPPQYLPQYSPQYSQHQHQHQHQSQHHNPSHHHHDSYSTGDVLNSNTDDPFSPPDYDKHLYDNNNDHCSDEDDQATIESQACDSIPMLSNNNNHHQSDNQSQGQSHYHQHNENNYMSDDNISCYTESSNYTNSTYTSTCSTVNNHNAMVPCCNPQPKQDKFILRVPKNRKGRIYINK